MIQLLRTIIAACAFVYVRNITTSSCVAERPRDANISYYTEKHQAYLILSTNFTNILCLILALLSQGDACAQL